MAVDIGAEAIDLPDDHGSGATLINKEHPATVSGTITSIDIWADRDISNLRVGSFYTINGNTLKCRDSVAIGSVTSGAKRTFTELSIAVEIGDYIGCYYTSGYIERQTYGYAGIWRYSGERIDPGDEAEYTFYAGDVISLGGYIGVLVVGRSFGFIIG